MPKARRTAVQGVLLEACVTTPAEAVSAAAAGAHRVELCRALDVGGLTPALQLLERTRAALEDAGLGETPVHCMVRPTPGRFVARPPVVAAMAAEVRSLREGGADGLVLGILTDAGGVDLDALGTLMEVAGELPVTFHRAFDHLPDPLGGLAGLGELGVARVLTGGGPGTAWEGRDALASLVAASRTTAGLPAILGAGRIRGDHAESLLRHTGLREIHARACAFPALTRAIRGVATGG